MNYQQFKQTVDFTQVAERVSNERRELMNDDETFVVDVMCSLSEFEWKKMADLILSFAAADYLPNGELLEHDKQGAIDMFRRIAKEHSIYVEQGADKHLTDSQINAA